MQKIKSYEQVPLRIAFKCQHTPIFEKEVSNEKTKLFDHSAYFEAKFRFFKSYLLVNSDNNYFKVIRVIEV